MNPIRPNMVESIAQGRPAGPYDNPQAFPGVWVLGARWAALSGQRHRALRCAANGPGQRRELGQAAPRCNRGSARHSAWSLADVHWLGSATQGTACSIIWNYRHSI